MIAEQKYKCCWLQLKKDDISSTVFDDERSVSFVTSKNDEIASFVVDEKYIDIKNSRLKVLLLSEEESTYTISVPAYYSTIVTIQKNKSILFQV